MTSEIAVIDDVALGNFRRLYKKLYGADIGYEESKETASNLLGFIKFLLEKQNVYEKRIQKTTTK